MENPIQKFDFKGHEVRIVDRNGDSWFVGKDACDILDVRDVRQAIERLDDDERCLTPLVDSAGKKQEMWIISEPGLYALIQRSRKPAAREFDRWVRHEVLPTIRKTGSYGIQSQETGLREFDRTILNQMMHHMANTNRMLDLIIQNQSQLTHVNATLGASQDIAAMRVQQAEQKFKIVHQERKVKGIVDVVKAWPDYMTLNDYCLRYGLPIKLNMAHSQVLKSKLQRAGKSIIRMPITQSGRTRFLLLYPIKELHRYFSKNTLFEALQDD